MSHYEILQVAEQASQEEIRAAYLRLVQQHHPDRKVGDATDDESRVQFNRIQEAYEVLYDPEQRKAYDNKRIPQPKNRNPSAQPQRTPSAGVRPVNPAVRRDVPSDWLRRSGKLPRRKRPVLTASFVVMLLALAILVVPRCSQYLEQGEVIWPETLEQTGNSVPLQRLDPTMLASTAIDDLPIEVVSGDLSVSQVPSRDVVKAQFIVEEPKDHATSVNEFGEFDPFGIEGVEPFVENSLAGIRADESLGLEQDSSALADAGGFAGVDREPIRDLFAGDQSGGFPNLTELGFPDTNLDQWSLDQGGAPTFNTESQGTNGLLVPEFKSDSSIPGGKMQDLTKPPTFDFPTLEDVHRFHGVPTAPGNDFFPHQKRLAARDPLAQEQVDPLSTAIDPGTNNKFGSWSDAQAADEPAIPGGISSALIGTQATTGTSIGPGLGGGLFNGARESPTSPLDGLLPSSLRKAPLISPGGTLAPNSKWKPYSPAPF